jgi:hypothetical protein
MNSWKTYEAVEQYLLFTLPQVSNLREVVLAEGCDGVNES